MIIISQKKHSGRLLLASPVWDHFCQPLEVGRVSLLDPGRDDLSHIVRVILTDVLGHALDAGGPGLDHHEDLFVVLNLALPLVDRGDARHNVDTGSKFPSNWKK